MLGYLRRGGKRRLYRQWVERAGLPPEAVLTEAGESEDVPPHVCSSEAVRPEARKPLRVDVEPDDGIATHPGIAGDMMAEIDNRQLRLPMLYLLLGGSALILFAGLILLVVFSC